MALIDMFGSSISGLAYGQALLARAAGTIANPASYGYRSTTSDSAFAGILNAQIAAVVRADTAGRDGVNRGTAGIVFTPVIAPPAALAGDAGQDLIGAVVDMLIARRIIEANARMISIQNKVVGTIIHLGE